MAKGSVRKKGKQIEEGLQMFRGYIFQFPFCQWVFLDISDCSEVILHRTIAERTCFAVFPKQYITFNPMQYIKLRYQTDEVDLFSDEDMDGNVQPVYLQNQQPLLFSAWLVR